MDSDKLKTKAERAVFSALEALQHATPLEIHAWLQRHSSVRPGVTSVYRAINGLMASHVIRKLSFDREAAYYEIVEQHHHHHMICRRCKRVTELVFCPLSIARPHLRGFEVSQHRFEVFGICLDCSRRRTSEDRAHRGS